MDKGVEMFSLPYDDLTRLMEISSQLARLDMYRWISTFMYVVFAVGLFYLASQRHAAIVRGERPPGQFPPGYFTMLTVQVLPLLISGFVLHDEFIIATRVGTLAIALVSYALVYSQDGTFDGWWTRLWLLFWLSAASIGVMLWHDPSTHVEEFFRAHEQLISWAAVIAMMMFVLFGQRVAAKTLYWHFMQGNYSIKRFSLQWVRWLAFAAQTMHYWHTPSAADAIRLKFDVLAYRLDYTIDPIFAASAMGTAGVTFVLLWSIVGLIGGSEARRAKKYADRERRLDITFAGN